MRVGFLGLGSMGQLMAQNLLRAGHELTVYNRTQSATEPLQQQGASVARSPAEAAQTAEVLITMLADDAAVETVLFDPTHGVIQTLPQTAVHLSMSTISVALSQRLAADHRTAGQGYLTAPVFGRTDAAAQAALWIVAAGEPKLLEFCRPLLTAMSQGVFYVGAEPWQANLVKLSGNLMIAAVLETLGETFALMQKAGVAPEQFLEIVNTALFKSPLYQNYGNLMVQQRYEPAGFKLRLGLKDVRLAVNAAEGLDVPLPLAGLIRNHLVTAIAQGHGEIDWAGLARVHAQNAGLSSIGQPQSSPQAS